MSDNGDEGRATRRLAETRFQKGRSGNPKGRPRSKPKVPISAFDVVINRTMTITHQGAREVRIEEALQHKTYQAAIGGSRAARREVLKWITKREQWLAARAAPDHRSTVLLLDTHDPKNANEALLLLGVAEQDTRYPDMPTYLRLRPWAVQAALKRRRGPLSERDVSDIRRSTRDAATLRWPAGTKHPDE